MMIEVSLDRKDQSKKNYDVDVADHDQEMRRNETQKMEQEKIEDIRASK